MLGLDFGTTNSAIAAVAPDGSARLATFDARDGRTATFRSILYIDPEAPAENGLPPKVSAGPAAVQAWLDTGGRGRLIQSIKAHLASRLFTTTNLFGVQYRLEDLIALFLRALRRAAVEQLDDPGRAVVVGRPVHFSGAQTDEDDAFAEQRLRSAVQQAGFEDVVFALEPLAAATQYQQRLDHEELVLIGDFGGGTSDFSLVRLGPQGSTILGVDGVALAGDAFDARLIRHLAAPGLGLGSLRRTPFGNELPMPGWIYERVERWDQLSFLKSRDTLETLRTMRHESLEPEKIDALMHLVDDDLGFRLHGDIEGTKRALSAETHAAFRFDVPPIALAADVERGEMETWIAPVVDAIAECVERLFVRAAVPETEVATVFLTGGTAFVPAVRALFAARFPRATLRGGDELTTVAKGLALRAAEGG